MATPVHLWEFLGIEGSIELSQTCMWFSIYVSGLCLFILIWCCPVCDRMNYDCVFSSLSCTVLQNLGIRSQSAMRAADRNRQPRRYYYERSRAQIAARQARSQAKQRFTELARMRSNPQNPVLTEKDDIKRVGSRLIVLMDYPAPQDDELSLEFGEAVFADVLKQAGAERIWAYCPRVDKCGFIPVSLVVPPAV